MDGVTDEKVLNMLSKDYDVIRKIASKVIPLDAKELEQYHAEVSMVVKRVQKTSQIVQNYFDSIRIMYDKLNRAMKESSEAINRKVHQVLDELANSLTDKYHLKKRPEPEKSTDSGIEESLPSVSDLESTIDNSVMELETYTASTDSETDEVHLQENLGLLKRKIEMIGKTKRKKYKPKAQNGSGENGEEQLKDDARQNKPNSRIASSTKPGSAKKEHTTTGRSVKGRRSDTIINRSTVRKVSSSRERVNEKKTHTVSSIIKPRIPKSGVVRRLQTLKTLQQIEYEKRVIEEFLIKTDNVIKLVKEGLHIGKQEVEDLNLILHSIEHSKTAMKQTVHEDVKKEEDGQSKCEEDDKVEKDLTFQEERVKYSDTEIENEDNLTVNKDADTNNREEEERKLAVGMQLKEEWNTAEETHNKLEQKVAELLEKVTDLSSGQHDHRKRQDEIRLMVDGDIIKKKKEEEEERIKRAREEEEKRIMQEKEAEETRLRQEREYNERLLHQQKEEEIRLKQLREEEERKRQLIRELEESRLKMEKELEETKMEEEMQNAKKEEERKRKREAILAKINVERKHWKEKILHDGMEDAEMSELTQFTLIRGPDELLKSRSLTSSLSNQAQIGSNCSPFELQERMASQFVEIKAEERIECGAQAFVEAVKIHEDSTTVVKVSIDGENWEERVALHLTVTTGDRQTKHLVGAEFADFQNLSMVVAARNKTEHVLVKDKEITIKSQIYSNIRVTIPAKAFDEEETNLRLSVYLDERSIKFVGPASKRLPHANTNRECALTLHANMNVQISNIGWQGSEETHTTVRKMLDTDLEKAKVLHQGCHNIISISPILVLNCQNKCKKSLKFRFAKSAVDTNKTKQIGVVWCEGEKWEIAGDSNEILTKVNQKDYCCFLIRTVKDANSQNILTAAQQLFLHYTETLSQILCVQKTTDPSTLRVECVPIQKVSERFSELEQKGYSLNPNVSQELCVQDGENITIKCTENIKLDSQLNGEVVLIFTTYMNTASTNVRILPKDRSSQANQEDYTGDLVFTILSRNDGKTRLSGSIVLKIPKKLSPTSNIGDSKANEESKQAKKEQEKTRD